MPDPNDFDLPDPATPPEAPVPPPAPPSEDLDNLRSRSQQLEEELLRMRRANETLLQEVLTSRRAPAAPAAPEPPPPDRDADPDAYIAWQVDRRIREALNTTVAPLVRGYEADRAQLFESTVRSSLDRVARDYPSEWSAYAAEVEQYLSMFPPQERARPGAVEEAFARVVGRHTLLKAKEASARYDAAIPAGRPSVPPTAPPPAKPQLSPEQLRHLARTGMSAEEFNTLRESGGRMDVDDFLAHKEAMKAKKGVA